MSKPLIQQLQVFCQKNRIPVYGSKWVVGVSGGADSTALCLLAKEAGVSVVLVHINYGLRGEDSVGDEMFVRELAKQLSLPLFVRSFPLAADAANIQSLAREERYRYLEEIRKQTGSHVVATAHQQEDQAETVIQQLIRGSGLEGLSGIRPKRNRLIRPLLFAAKEQLIHFLEVRGQRWREDVSNTESYYQRNQIRQEILPRLEAIRAGSAEAIARSAENMQALSALWHQQKQRFSQWIRQEEKELKIIPIKPFITNPLFREFVRELLMDAGFNRPQFANILDAAQQPQAQTFSHGHHRLMIYRNRMEWRSGAHDSLLPISWEPEQTTLIIGKQTTYHRTTVTLSAVPDKITQEELFLPLQYANTSFTLRYTRTGDYFYPSGMKRKKKKVSLFLKDLGLSPEERKTVVLLCDQEQILWIAGYRADERIRLHSASFPGEFVRIQWQRG